MKMCMNNNANIYVKSFPGATTEDMCHYSKPSKKYDNNLYLLHTGTNDLRSNKSVEEIANDIVHLAKDNRKRSCD